MSSVHCIGTLRVVVSTVLAGWLVLSCASIRVGHDFDPEVDFTGFRTYGWLTGPEGQGGNLLVDNDLIAGRIRGAVDSNLSARGYSPATSGSPDFMLGYHLSTEKKVRVTTVDDFYGYDPYWGPAGRRETRVREYDVGTLVIDVVKASSNELVWRGWGKARLSKQELTPEESTKAANEAVSAILAAFPPDAGGG
jgi:hypothetical protein